MSLCLSRLVRLTLSDTGSIFRLVLDSRFPEWNYLVLGNWITDSLKGIIWFPGYPGIGGSSTYTSDTNIEGIKCRELIIDDITLVKYLLYTYLLY